MSPVREVCLSLNDVEDMIVFFERKHGVSSADFFRDDEIRGQIPEDDIFRWDALIYHRLALRDSNQEVRSAYLAQLRHPSVVVLPDKENVEEALAA